MSRNTRLRRVQIKIDPRLREVRDLLDSTGVNRLGNRTLKQKCIKVPAL